MPNYFTMKMREGTKAPDDREKVIDFLTKSSSIGIGEEEFTTGAGTFLNDIQIGDIIVLRAGRGPVALLKVVSDSYEYKSEGKFPAFDNWLAYARKVEVISWYDEFCDSYPGFIFDARGYMQTCAAITGDNLPIVLKWYEESMDCSHSHYVQGLPNIFSFAPSELSQDAMFAWLLSWANPQYAEHDPSLYSVAIKFTKLLTGISDLQIKTINVGKQWRNIDVSANINDDVFLLIEDKTGTSIHDDQLVRYKGIVENEYPNRIKCYAYVKTENEPKSILKKVEDAGYRVVLRKDILDCLNAYNGTNSILCSYRERLNWLEEDTQGFKTLSVGDWSGNAWKGFYTELEQKVFMADCDSWNYVPNPSGGFWGAWWHFTDFSIDRFVGQMYLQFEEAKLCFKICPDYDDESERSDIRDRCHDALLETASNRFPEMHKPARFSVGDYMTIAVVDPEQIFGRGVLDIEAIVAKLKRYEALIDECCHKK